MDKGLALSGTDQEALKEFVTLAQDIRLTLLSILTPTYQIDST